MAGAKIQGLQIGRALAAIAVVLLHASVAASMFGHGPSGASWLFEKGYLGVDFFFVLSGFIIYHVHAGDRDDAPAAAAYMGKRLIRIFVPYWPIGLTMGVAYHLWFEKRALRVVARAARAARDGLRSRARIRALAVR